MMVGTLIEQETRSEWENPEVFKFYLANLTEAGLTTDIANVDFVTLIDYKTSALGGSSFMYNFFGGVFIKKKEYFYSFWLKPEVDTIIE